MKRFVPLAGLALISASTIAAPAPKSFDGLACPMDLEKALVGRDMPNEPVAKTEARNKGLDLKNLGGYEITDELFLAFWRVCGDEFALLQQGDRIKAALKLGKHGEGSEAMICHPKDASKNDVYVAAPGAKKTKAGITADRAWRIDAKSASFAPLVTGPLECAPEDE